MPIKTICQFYYSKDFNNTVSDQFLSRKPSDNWRASVEMQAHLSNLDDGNIFWLKMWNNNQFA